MLKYPRISILFSLTGELDVVPGPALAVLRLAGVVPHVTDLEGERHTI